MHSGTRNTRGDLWEPEPKLEEENRFKVKLHSFEVQWRVTDEKLMEKFHVFNWLLQGRLASFSDLRIFN